MLPEPGPALYIGAEDDETELHIRTSAICKHYGVTFAELADAGFQMMTLFGADATLAVPTRAGTIEPTSLFHQLYEVAGDTKPKGIGLDSSANMFAGNEIDRAQVTQFVGGCLGRLAKVCDGTVILLSHPSLTGINSGSGLSGSTHWHNSARGRMYLTSPKPEAGEQPDTDLRELIFKKNNYGPIGDSVILRYKNGLFLPEAGTSSLEKAAREAKVDDAFLAGLRKFVGQGQSLSSQTNSSDYAARRIAEIDVAKGFTLKELKAAQQRLLDARKVHIRKEGRPSRPTRSLYPGPPGDSLDDLDP